MRACQFCSAKSWSPSKEQDRHAEVRLLECGGCGAWGREDLIIEPLPDGEPKVGDPYPGGFIPPFPIGSLSSPIDYAAEVRKALQGLIPDKAPETRTERLVRELIRSDSFAGLSGNESDCALWLVGMARAIEYELDRCVVHSPESIPEAHSPESIPEAQGLCWTCPTCGFVNDSYGITCGIRTCNTPRPL